MQLRVDSWQKGLFGLHGSLSPLEHLVETKTDDHISGCWVASPRSCRPARPSPPPGALYLWSAKVSLFSAFRVPAVANMMVVSRSAMIPDTAVAAVMHAWVPLFPAWRADSTKDTCRQ